MANTVISSSGIALISDGKIFLIKPYKSVDRWGIPKGHLDGDEDIQKTAIREFTEETGIKIVGVLKYFTTVTTGYKDVIKNVNVYKCIGKGTEKFTGSNLITTGDDVGNPENTEGGWFTYNEALEKVHPYQIPIIKKLKAEDNSFRSFHDNRVTNLATSELLYNSTITLLVYDSRLNPRQHLYLIQKYMNISDEVIIFIKPEDDRVFYAEALEHFKNKIPKKLKRIQYFCDIDIINYVVSNFKKVNILLGADKELKTYKHLYNLYEQLYDKPSIYVLDPRTYAM